MDFDASRLNCIWLIYNVKIYILVSRNFISRVYQVNICGLTYYVTQSHKKNLFVFKNCLCFLTRSHQRFIDSHLYINYFTFAFLFSFNLKLPVCAIYDKRVCFKVKVDNKFYLVTGIKYKNPKVIESMFCQ